MDDRLANGFRIGDRIVEPMRGRIVAADGETHLEPRAMDVLLALARRAGETVSRDEIVAAVWKHPHVTDEALSRCISLLRHALGDDRAPGRYVETVPKRGYRLAVPVESSTGNGNGTASPHAQVDSSARIPDWERTNIALQPTRIIDREDELAEIHELLGSQRLVTLTGSAGVGKTRLALEYASRCTTQYADGVWLVEFAPLSDPARVTATVASVLRVKLGATDAPAVELSRKLAARSALLILDNCEHMIDAVATVADAMLGAAPNVRMLATSQVLVGIAGEQAYPVPPLDVPDEVDAGSPEAAMAAASVRLFVERARAADPHFLIGGDDVHAVAAVCRRLEGIPLAIEMAAARAPMLGVATLARLLDERFRILTSGRRNAPMRQQTLRATFDWSFGLLSEREATVLNRLSVFAGGFTLEAASAIGDVERIDRIDVVDILGRLVARSLVVVETSPTGKRYRLLETTRAYAQERLAESRQVDDALAHHLDYFLALAEAARPELLGAHRAEWTARLDRERENFLVAHSTCDTEHRGAELGLRLVIALKSYWIHCGGMELGFRVASQALNRPGAQRRNLTRSRALSAAAQLASCMGRQSEVTSYQEEALAIAREEGDEEQLVFALLAMCDRAYLAREVEQALGYAKEALDLARARRHSPAYASALLWVAELDRLAGNLDAAERNHREVLCVAREAGRQPDIVVTLLNLSSIAIARGGAREVPAMLLEALEVVVRIASEPLGANVLLIASALAAHLKSWRLAAKLFGAGDAQCIRTGFRREPTDEAFIAPLVAKARHAVGNAVFGQAEAAGRLLDYDTALAEARRWLQSCATHPGGASNVVALPPR